MRYTIIILLLLAVHFLRAQKPAHSGTNRAVLFYSTTFQYGWGPLPETKNESELIADELKINYGFEVELIPNPNKQDIENKILELNNREYGPGDQLLLFFSMHGYYRNRGYLIPSDGKLQRNDPLGKSWLSYDDLGTYLSLNSCQHVLLLLDACYSGSFGDRWKGGPTEMPWDEEISCQEKIKNALAYDSRIYFTSGSKYERTPASSLFAKRLLGLLRSGIEKKIIRSNDLRYELNSIEKTKPEGGTFSNRHQEYGDFVFVYKNACDLEGRAVQSMRLDKEAWLIADEEGTIEGYKKYIELFPNGEFVEPSRLRIGELEELLDWSYARSLKSIVAYKNFIQKYPDSEYVKVANIEIKKLENNGFMDELADEEVFGLNKIEGGTIQIGRKSYQVPSFYISPYEVTFEEYDVFCEDVGYEYPLDDRWGRGKQPVINVTWYDAVNYCNWKSKQDGLEVCYDINGYGVKTDFTKKGYRLPTEMEWEYAARLSMDSMSNLDSTAWYAYNSERQPHIVGEKATNFYGIHDILGNVAEWCNDWYSEQFNVDFNDKFPGGPRLKIAKGGSWKDMSRFCKPEDRSVVFDPKEKKNTIGFRLVRSRDLSKK